MSVGPGPEQDGLQQARTALAWRRTALSLCGATLVLVKVALPSWGAAVSLGCLLLGVTGALALTRVSARRYRADRGAGTITASRAILLTTVLLGLLAITAAAVVVTRR